LSVFVFTVYLILGIEFGMLGSFIGNIHTIIFHCW
jgi:hypothetical protein